MLMRMLLMLSIVSVRLSEIMAYLHQIDMDIDPPKRFSQVL